MQFVSYDSFVLLCWNQRDNLRISEFERGCVQLIASYMPAFNFTSHLTVSLTAMHVAVNEVLSHLCKILSLSGPAFSVVRQAWGG